MNKETFENLLIERVLTEYKNIPARRKYRFSKKFEAEIRRVFNDNQPQPETHTIRFTKYVILAAILIAMMVATVAACAYTQRFFTLDRITFAGGVAPCLSEAPLATLEPATFQAETLPYVPKGYSLLNSLSTDVQYTEIYVDEQGSLLVFDKFSASVGINETQWFKVAVDGEITEIVVGNTYVSVIEQRKYYVYLWANEACFFSLQISRTLNDDVIEDILKAAILKN